MSDRPHVCIVVPVYNEAASLPQLVERLGTVMGDLQNEYEFSLIFVDDGSTDGTVELLHQISAREPRLGTVRLRRNYGQTAALQTGFDHASGDIVVSMDADLQHFPEDIPLLLAKLQEGYDVVCGWRHDRQEGILRRWPSAAANWILRKTVKLDIHDIGTTFRAYRREILQDFRLLGENHRFVPVFARQAGARIAEVRIQNVERTLGQSNYGLSRTLNVLLDIAFLAFYVHYLDRPMRLFGRAGLIVLTAAVSIAVGLTILYVRDGVSVVRDRSGWFMLGLILGLAAMQFFFFGLLSELLVRTYFASRARSAYPTRE